MKRRYRIPAGALVKYSAPLQISDAGCRRCGARQASGTAAGRARKQSAETHPCPPPHAGGESRSHTAMLQMAKKKLVRRPAAAYCCQNPRPTPRAHRRLWRGRGVPVGRWTGRDSAAGTIAHDWKRRLPLRCSGRVVGSKAVSGRGQAARVVATALQRRPCGWWRAVGPASRGCRCAVVGVARRLARSYTLGPCCVLPPCAAQSSDLRLPCSQGTGDNRAAAPPAAGAAPSGNAARKPGPAPAGGAGGGASGGKPGARGSRAPQPRLASLSL